MLNKVKVAVLGSGNMGTALAQVIAKNNYQVSLWNHAGDLAPLEQIKKYRENKKYLPKIKLSSNIVPEANLAMALAGAEVVFLAVPSFCIEDVVKQAKDHLGKNAVCVDVSKGIDQKSLGIIPDVIKKNLPFRLHNLVSTISGPAIAVDMANGGFTAMNVGSKNRRAIALVKQVLENEHLRLFATTDIVGIEVVGSFKNVYAIAMGICDGLKIPMNTKAALLTIALKEISVLCEKMGGKTETIYGLAGLGDLIGTGLCRQSRNRSFGECLSLGLDVNASLSKVGQVVEGISAAKVLRALGKKYNLKLDFAEMIYQVSSGREKAAPAMKKYLSSL